jgi:hypothetical protein
MAEPSVDYNSLSPVKIHLMADHFVVSIEIGVEQCGALM